MCREGALKEGEGPEDQAEHPHGEGYQVHGRHHRDEQTGKDNCVL